VAVSMEALASEAAALASEALGLASEARLRLPRRWLWCPWRLLLGLAGRMAGLGSRLALGSWLGLGRRLGLGPWVGLDLALEPLCFPLYQHKFPNQNSVE
jgi:hypothetical protein